MSNVTYKHVSTTSTGALAPTGSHAALVAVNVGTGAASAVLTLYDGVNTGGIVIATIDASAKGTYWFGGVRCTNGLFFGLAGGNADVTISFI